MKQDGRVSFGQDDRVGALERRLAALEQQRQRAERWAGLLVALALLAVSGSLMLLTEKLALTQTAHPRPRRQPSSAGVADRSPPADAKNRTGP
jgi:uncharacterized iron-regulated membrane protein